MNIKDHLLHLAEELTLVGRVALKWKCATHMTGNLPE